MAVRDDEPDEAPAKAPAPTEPATSGPRPRARRALPLAEPGSSYHGYVIKGEAGRGGLGRVLRAHDRWLDRPVALKEVLHEPIDPDSAARFLREARLTARLQHPSIVPVYEIGFRDDGAPYYAMKLIEGERFDRIVERTKTLPERLALLSNVIAVAEAIAYAHEHRIIHRDLKPSNVLVGAFGETVVIDWGTAKDLSDPGRGEALVASSERGATRAPDVALGDTLVQIGSEGSSAETRMGATIGTLAYMPPEQLRGAEVDERADVFALGAFLYHTVTGAPPYAGMSEVRARIAEGAPVPIEEREPGVPRDVAAIVRKAMAPDAADRYATAKALVADLRRLQNGQLVSARVYTPRVLVGRWVARHKRAVATALVFLLSLAALGAVSVVRVVRERDRAEAARAQARAAEGAAEDARRQAEARTQQVTLVEARTSLDDDPTASLAWLKTAKITDADWAEIASIAAEADARGVARESIRVPAVGDLDGVSLDGRWAFLRPAAGGLVVVDSTTGAVERLRSSSSPTNLHAMPDHAHLVAGSKGGEILILDVATRALRAVAAHEGECFVNPGWGPTAFVSYGADGTVRTWDVATGQGRTLGRHDAGVLEAFLSPDGRSVVSLGKDGSLVFWDAASGAKTRVERAPGIFRIEWSPSGKRLVLHGPEGVTVRDVATGAHRLLAGKDVLREGGFFATLDRYVVGGWDGSVRLYDLDAGTDRLLGRHAAPIEGIDAREDGTAVASCSEEGVAKVWDLGTSSVRTLLGHKGPLYGCAFSVDGETLLTAGNDSMVRFWGLARGAERLLSGHEGDLYAVAFSPDGRLLVTGGNDPAVRVWDLVTGQARSLLGHQSSVARATFLGDSSRLATISEDHTARVWDLAKGTSVVLPHDDKVFFLAATRDGATLVTAGGEDPVVRAWDVATRAAVRMVGHEGFVTSVALSPDGTRVVSASADRTARVWDAKTGASQLVLRGHTSNVTGAVFAAGGSIVATSSDDGTVRLWSAATGEIVRVLQGHTDAVGSVEASSDGRRIATAGSDRTIRVWDVATGESRVLAGHTEKVRKAMFSRDGRRIVSSSYDGTARVWDAETGRLVFLMRSGDPVMRADLSPDGDVVASVGWDRLVHVGQLDARYLVPTEAGALRAWLDAKTSAVVGEGGTVGKPTK